MRPRPVPAATKLCPANMLPLLTLLAIIPAAAVARNTTTEPCALASCGRLNITFPFWLAGTHPSECGYKDFQVNCDKGDASLENTYWAYKISDILYEDNSFRVANLNLSDDPCGNDLKGHAASDITPLPFVISTQNQELFFLYDCQRQARQLPRSWAPVSCASESANSSFALLGGMYRPDTNLTQLPGNCTVSPLPVLGFKGATGADYQRLVKGGFLLQYMDKAEACDDCMAAGGRCRVNSTDDVFECHCSDGVHPRTCADEDKEELFYG